MWMIKAFYSKRKKKRIVTKGKKPVENSLECQKCLRTLGKLRIKYLV
jgi:hypothetical protein